MWSYATRDVRTVPSTGTLRDVIQLPFVEGLGPGDHVHPVGVFIAEVRVQDAPPRVDKIMRGDRIPVAPAGVLPQEKAPGPAVR